MSVYLCPPILCLFKSQSFSGLFLLSLMSRFILHCVIYAPVRKDLETARLVVFGYVAKEDESSVGNDSYCAIGKWHRPINTTKEDYVKVIVWNFLTIEFHILLFGAWQRDLSMYRKYRNKVDFTTVILTLTSWPWPLSCDQHAKIKSIRYRSCEPEICRYVRMKPFKSFSLGTRV